MAHDLCVRILDPDQGLLSVYATLAQQLRTLETERAPTSKIDPLQQACARVGILIYDALQLTNETELPEESQVHAAKILEVGLAQWAALNST